MGHNENSKYMYHHYLNIRYLYGVHRSAPYCSMCIWYSDPARVHNDQRSHTMTCLGGWQGSRTAQRYYVLHSSASPRTTSVNRTSGLHTVCRNIFIFFGRKVSRFGWWDGDGAPACRTFEAEINRGVRRRELPCDNLGSRAAARSSQCTYSLEASNTATDGSSGSPVDVPSWRSTTPCTGLTHRLRANGVPDASPRAGTRRHYKRCVRYTTLGRVSVSIRYRYWYPDTNTSRGFRRAVTIRYGVCTWR